MTTTTYATTYVIQPDGSAHAERAGIVWVLRHELRQRMPNKETWAVTENMLPAAFRSLQAGQIYVQERYGVPRDAWTECDPERTSYLASSHNSGRELFLTLETVDILA